MQAWGRRPNPSSCGWRRPRYPRRGTARSRAGRRPVAGEQLLVAAALDDARASTTKITSALRTVHRRCAMTSVVRPRESCVERVLDRGFECESSDEVASSRMKIGGSLSTRARSPRAASRRPRAVAALADDRVVAVRQPVDELVDVRGARGGVTPRRSRRAARSACCRGSMRGTGTAPASRRRCFGE